MHTPASKAREMLQKLSQVTPTNEAKPQETLEVESEAEHESTSQEQTSAITPIERETSVLGDTFDFEDEYFTEYGNTSKYHTVRKP